MILFATLLAPAFGTPKTELSAAHASAPLPLTTSAPRPSEQATEASAADAYGQLPLTFEPNHGQLDAEVQFLSRAAGYALMLTPTEAVLKLQRTAQSTAADGAGSATTEVVRMRFVDGSSQPALAGLDQQPGTVNYYTGRHPGEWHTQIPTYGKIRYDNVYPGSMPSSAVISNRSSTTLS